VPDSNLAARVRQLAELPFNFDPATEPESSERWYRDAHAEPLPLEPPGPVVSGGSFEVAKELLYHYRFPNPRRVVGYFDHQAPLQGRNMLLRASFAGFVFEFGVRVVQVVDEIVDTPDGPVAAWGYSYRTLEGHWEKGEIYFGVDKHMDSGRVTVRTRSYSRPGSIPHLVHRIGFRVFGRSLQEEFARDCVYRTRRYVEHRLRAGHSRGRGALDPGSR
jgi:uncharacterized protein (UPF0548 family)